MSARRVRFRFFRGTLATWDELFGKAARFAEALPAGDLISISHSADQSDGVVTVWYWSDQAPPELPPERRPDY